MKVLATKTMTREINKALHANGEKMRAEYVTMSRRAFSFYVDSDIWENERDYMPDTDEMRAIKILYPHEYYAMPQYLTSAELVRIFQKSDKTFDGFMDAVIESIQI